MSCKFFISVIECINPIFQTKCNHLFINQRSELLSRILTDNHFRRFKALQQLLYIFGRTAGGHKFTSRYSQKSYSHFIWSKINRSKIVVGLSVKHIVIIRQSGCNQLGNTSLNDSFCNFRVFKLIANSYTFTSSHQFWQVCIQCVMRKAGQLNFGCGSVGPFCKNDIQDLAGFYRITSKCFIKIANTKK